jgi:predicted Zn finger-like uncharacterized protein
MLIVCPSCASEYTIDPARVGADGRAVRCAACRTKWFVEPQGPPESGEGPDAPGGTMPEDAPATQPLPALAEDAPLSVEARTGRGPDPELAGRRRRRSPRERSPAPRRPLLRTLSAPLRLARSLPAGLLVTTLALGAATTALAARAQVVRALPDTAVIYAGIGLPVNLRGLELRNVRSELLTQGPDVFLVVEGSIAGVAAGPVPVPDLEIAVRDGAAQPLYTWTHEPPLRRMDPGESMRFRARLAAPPAESREVFVRFAPPKAAR